MALVTQNQIHTNLTSGAARWPPQYAPAPADRRPTCLQI